MKQQLEEGQIVLCEVTQIVGTSVFVKLEDYNLEGSISFPEIAPGRIRNIRDFAFPGKKIVCKVLAIRSGGLELSLRRVKVNERNDFNDRYRKEKSYSAMLRTILKEKAELTIAKIREGENSLFDFIEEAKENLKLLEKYLPKEEAEKISNILKEKRAKEVIVHKKFSLSSKSSDGILKVKTIIKEATKDIQESEVSYLAAGKYLLKIKSKDPKQADQNIRKVVETLESLSKKHNCFFDEEKD